MLKRVATQLQVLLPGETNAPGTATGKIGTPLPQAAGIPFDITINACDATWHIAASTDTVHLTTDDPSGYPPARRGPGQRHAHYCRRYHVAHIGQLDHYGDGYDEPQCCARHQQSRHHPIVRE